MKQYCDENGKNHLIENYHNIGLRYTRSNLNTSVPIFGLETIISLESISLTLYLMKTNFVPCKTK